MTGDAAGRDCCWAVVAWHLGMMVAVLPKAEPIRGVLYDFAKMILCAQALGFVSFFSCW